MRLIMLSALILVGLGTTLYQVKTSIDERQDLLSKPRTFNRQHKA